MKAGNSGSFLTGLRFFAPTGLLHTSPDEAKNNLWVCQPAVCPFLEN